MDPRSPLELHGFLISRITKNYSSLNMFRNMNSEFADIFLMHSNGLAWHIVHRVPDECCTIRIWLFVILCLFLWQFMSIVMFFYQSIRLSRIQFYSILPYQWPHSASEPCHTNAKPRNVPHPLLPPKHPHPTAWISIFKFFCLFVAFYTMKCYI